MRILAIALATVSLTFAVSLAPAWGKTVKECNAEYAANKDAIKGVGQKKADFMAACKAGTETIPGGAAAAPAPAAPAATTAAGGKTAKDCNGDYAANKVAISDRPPLTGPFGMLVQERALG